MDKKIDNIMVLIFLEAVCVLVTGFVIMQAFNWIIVPTFCISKIEFAAACGIGTILAYTKTVTGKAEITWKVMLEAFLKDIMYLFIFAIIGMLLK